MCWGGEEFFWFCCDVVVEDVVVFCDCLFVVVVVVEIVGLEGLVLLICFVGFVFFFFMLDGLIDWVLIFGVVDVVFYEVKCIGCDCWCGVMFFEGVIVVCF